MAEKFQLHVSGLNMLSRCGEQFRRRYIEGEIVPPGVALLIGTATDRSVSADLQHKIDSGALLPDEAIPDLARDTLLAEWDRGVVLDGDFAEIGYDAAKGEAVDMAISLAQLHHTELAPSIDATHVQRAWTLDVNGLDIQLAGTIDVQEGDVYLRDTKTSKKSPSADEAERSLQLTVYALAKKAHDGTPPQIVALDYLVKTKTPKVVTLESTRKDGDFDHALARVAQAARIIESGMFSPAPLDAWWCSNRFCGYHSTCPFARRPVTLPTT